MSDATFVDGEVARIGQRIRRWREQDGLTLQELGERSGLATSTVQKIETSQMIPSVAVILKLARGLRRPPSALIEERGAEPEVLALPASERHTMGVRNKLVVERISGDLIGTALDMWRITLYPGYSSGRGSMRFDGEALIAVESGTLTLEIDGKSHALGSDDALQFKTRLPHRWRNDGDGAVRFTITATISQRLRAAMQGQLRGHRERRSA